MPHRLTVVLAAALLASLPVLVSAADRHDDTVYPDVAATWASTVGTVDGASIVTADQTYPGPHATLVKSLPPAPRAEEAEMVARDDVVYPTADATSESSRTAVDP